MCVSIKECRNSRAGKKDANSKLDQIEIKSFIIHVMLHLSVLRACMGLPWRRDASGQNSTF